MKEQATAGRSRIDEIVSEHLASAGVAAAPPAPDAVFLRRIYLDTIGAPPTAEEARRFFDDRAPDRRARWIDQLLERREFAAYRAMQWGDLLCIKAEFPIDLWPVAAREYSRWLLESLAANQPYDQFAREILTSSGSNFRVGPVNFYRAVETRTPQRLAQAAARLFMGVRTDRWTATQQAGLALFFSRVAYKRTGEWKEEIVFDDTSKPLAASEAVLADGARVRLTAGADPRQLFAAWLTDAKNPYFARCLVNRVWLWLYGRALVDPPDDMRADNPALCPKLLGYLEAEFVRAGYDQKHIYRLILNSGVYQQSSTSDGGHPETKPGLTSYPVRRLGAETIIDAICQITGTNEQYASAIPEPYTILPAGERATSLPDGSITSAFLDLFGRSPRNTGMASERNNQPSTAQRLHLLNSSHIERKIEQGPALEPIFRLTDVGEIARQLYLTILSRYPSAAELKTASDYARTGGVNRRQAGVDLAWALLNSTEFLYQH